jgi:hypothetical protein
MGLEYLVDRGLAAGRPGERGAGELAYASCGTDIRPGDLLGAGTCQGGCLAELWGRHGRDTYPPLRPGDIVSTRVEGLGEISNRIVPSVAVHLHRPVEAAMSKPLVDRNDTRIEAHLREVADGVFAYIQPTATE